MNIGSMRIKKYELVTLICLLVAFAVALIPYTRWFVVQSAIFVLGRQLDLEWWMNAILTHFAPLICLCTIYFFNFVLFRRQGKRESYYVWNFLFFFIVSNFFIRITGDFSGYKISWDNADFIDCIKGGYGSGSLYTTNYPPLAVLLFRWLHQYLLNSDGSISDNAAIYVTNMYTLFIVISLFALFYKYLDRRVDKPLLVSASLFITSSMLFAFCRMNLMLLALVFAMLFLETYKSDNKWIKYVGLLALALSANIKYFPAIFGLLLIKEKRWKDGIVCAILGIVLFMAPMLIPKDNALITNQYVVIESLANTNDDSVAKIENDSNETRTENEIASIINSTLSFADSDRVIGRTLTPQSVIYNILVPFGINERTAKAIGKVALLFNLVLLMILFFLTKKRYIELMSLALFSFSVVTTSNWYFTIFMIPAFLEFISDNIDGVMTGIFSTAWICAFSYRWGFANSFILQDWIQIAILWLVFVIDAILELRERKVLHAIKMC